MPKIPKPTQNDIIKYLIRKGFFVKSQRGSHVVTARHYEAWLYTKIESQ